MNNSKSTLTPGLDRLEKYMAHIGLASRREAKDLIKSGLVKVNGKTITEPGFGIKPEIDKIEINSKSINKESILIYKPRGVETSATSTDAKDVHKVFPKYSHLAPVGRLDKDSEGLLILTNDGTITKSLTKTDSKIGKTYLVTVREFVTDSALKKMSNGIVLDKVITKKAITKRISRASFTITLYEGRKHQIRRMCDACRLTITSLVRIQIGPIKIDKMKPGSSRKLTSEEIKLLK